MAEPERMKPRAFVIMLFGVAFDQIYEFCFVPTLGHSGFEATRTDGIRSSRDAREDTLHGLDKPTLVVADLPDSNANVYSELGLAHAFRKRVVTSHSEA